MQIRDLLLPEFDLELDKTRKTLERVPEDKPDFKPHEKSMAISRLAGHLAQLPSLGTRVLTLPELDFATAGMKPLVMESREQLLGAFDGNVREVREKLAAASDDELLQPWKLSFEGKVFAQGTLSDAPRAAAQPYYSSPRPVRRLSPAEQRSCTIDLRTIRRRDVDKSAKQNHRSR